MDAVLYAVLAGVGSALITSTTSAWIFRTGSRKATRDEHLRRAFDTHLKEYEEIFVSARTAQDALRSYSVISGKVRGGFDPFLLQLLTIAEDAAHKYCVAVTWNHNPGMLYLSKKLESKCLRVRELLHRWLAVRRVYAGNVAFICVDDDVIPIPAIKVPKLRVGSYRELRLETRSLIVTNPDEPARLDEINRGLTDVISELKEVMSY
jgi:hypothetical protein